MTSKENANKAVEFLKKTLPELNKRNIPATPENYAVWYEFVSGNNPSLNKVIKELDQTPGGFSDDNNHKLYIDYIANENQAAFNTLSEGVKQLITDFLGRVTKEGSGLNQYAQSLQDFSTEVGKTDDISVIKGLIGKLLDETKKREEQTKQMQTTIESVAMEMTKLRSEVSRLNSEATTDSLTKVKNRRAFDMEIENLISACKMDSKPLSLLLLDIDHFKQFNDKFGHMIGDRVLRFVATLLKKNIKGSDSVARFGGEEFAILLPETEYKGAMAVAENIRKKLATQTLSDSTENIQLGKVTISIGVSCYLYGETSDEMIGRADRCMYEAKRGGRNKVVGEKELGDSGNQKDSQAFV